MRYQSVGRILACITCTMLPVSAGNRVVAQELESVTITAVLRGVVNEQDARVLRDALHEIDGIEVDSAAIRTGQRGQFAHYFSPPFEIKFTDLNQVDIGLVAARIAQSPTPNRDEVAPFLNLVLFHPDGFIEEDDIIALREAIAGVNGLEIDTAGGVGGVPNEGRCWIRLSADGGANLIYVERALSQSGLPYRFVGQ